MRSRTGRGRQGSEEEKKKKAEPQTAEQKREAGKVNAARYKRYRRSTNAQVLEIVLRAALDKVGGCRQASVENSGGEGGDSVLERAFGETGGGEGVDVSMGSAVHPPADDGWLCLQYGLDWRVRSKRWGG
jgi:hypothetical protein